MSKRSIGIGALRYLDAYAGQIYREVLDGDSQVRPGQLTPSWLNR